MEQQLPKLLLMVSVLTMPAHACRSAPVLQKHTRLQNKQAADGSLKGGHRRPPLQCASSNM